MCAERRRAPARAAALQSNDGTSSGGRCRYLPGVVVLAAIVGGRTTPALAQGDRGSPPPSASSPSPPSASSPPPPEAAPPQDVGGSSPSTMPSGDAAPLELTVVGARSDARRRQESAEAVQVVDLRKAREQTADLGEVVARTQGVAVRRAGGLGSGTRFSLNGLYDDQIRFFLDEVPLQRAGYPFGIANVPVNLAERVEIYRGVVPIRFGADALGGAVNLVTSPRYETRLAASYQVGSFGTHRATVDARYCHEPSGFVAVGSLFVDVARNDYRVDVKVSDLRGRESPANVPRFHDAYAATGGSLEVGFVERPWARKLLLRAFASTYDKELQHNIVMTVPYGEVTYGETVGGGTVRFEQQLLPKLELSVLANYVRRIVDFVDRGAWVYDWFGRRIRERRIGTRPNYGEIDNEPTDQTLWEDSGFGRVTLEWAPHPEHVFRAAFSPSYTTRSGDERLQSDPAERDPLTARRKIFSFVSGLEYELDALPVGGAPEAAAARRRGTDHAVQNSLFAKDYVYHVTSEEVLPGNVFRPLGQDTHAFGIGDGIRVRIAPWLHVKASYEYATRLPRPDEVFGNGVLIAPNLKLEPEVSHNGNLGPRLELRRTPVGDVTVDVNAFWRDSDRLIVLLGNDRFFTYQNVFRARAAGVEQAIAWVLPRKWVSLDGTVTYQDVRNVSTEGTFADFDGDRIPNRPWLFASWGARLRIPELPGPSDSVEPFYIGRYVHDFFRGWESQGLRESKQVVDAQLTHNVGVSWSVSADWARITTTFEVQNVTDAPTYDFFGVQRPGRAFYLKTTGELR